MIVVVALIVAVAAPVILAVHVHGNAPVAMIETVKDGQDGGVRDPAERSPHRPFALAPRSGEREG